jgi:hypothetical protein
VAPPCCGRRGEPVAALGPTPPDGPCLGR